MVLLIVETVYELQGTYTQVILNKHTASKVWIRQEVISIQMQLFPVEHIQSSKLEWENIQYTQIFLAINK